MRQTNSALFTRNMYLNEQGKVRPNASINGYLSVAVPGTVAGLIKFIASMDALGYVVVAPPSVLPKMVLLYQSTLLRQPSDARKLF